MRLLRLLGGTLFVSVLVINAPWAFGQLPAFRRTLEVGIKDPVMLDIVLSKGNVEIGYRRDGEVSISASAKNADGTSVSPEFFKKGLLITQEGSYITIRDTLNIGVLDGVVPTISYSIDVPFRTQVDSSVVGAGNQKAMGFSGPAKLTSGVGDINAMYIRFGQVQATTGKGKITCSRVLKVDAETGDGSITLMEDGPSKAVVKKGTGRIEVGGARGAVEGFTDGGELHIKAVLDDDWQFRSASGNIRIELPQKSSFDFEANTRSGSISIERDEMQKPAGEVHLVHQQVNGGGKHIQAQSLSGSIFLE